MSEERLILETIARCVAIMVNYHNSGPKERATREMVAEIQAVAEEVEKLSLGATSGGTPLSPGRSRAPRPLRPRVGPG